MSKNITTKMVRCLELKQIIKWLESVARFDDDVDPDPNPSYRNFLSASEVSSTVGAAATGGAESLQFISTVIPKMTQQIIAHSLTEAKQELQALLREVSTHVRDLELFLKQRGLDL